MNFFLPITFLSLIILSSSVFAQEPQLGNTTPQISSEPVVLDIAQELECESIGGNWNTCPPNECQQTEAYKKGEIVCPQVCGQSRCEGIVPEEEGNLSEIHNPTTVFREREQKQDINTQTPPEEPTIPNNQDTVKIKEEVIANSAKGNQTLILLIILGIVLLVVYYVIRKKK